MCSTNCHGDRWIRTIARHFFSSLYLDRTCSFRLGPALYLTELYPHLFAVARGIEPLFEPVSVLPIRRYHRKVVIPQSFVCSPGETRTHFKLSKASNPAILPRYWHFVVLWTPGGFEPHPSRCQRDVLPGYTTRPIIRQNLASCHQRKLPIRTVPVHLSRDTCAYNTDDNSVFVPSGESNQTHIWPLLIYIVSSCILSLEVKPTCTGQLQSPIYCDKPAFVLCPRRGSNSEPPD